MQKNNTRYWKIDDIHRDNQAIKEAGAIIARGGLVAFPTETVYGLGANALDGKAVKKIFKAKGRPSDNPLIVHVAGIDEVKKLSAGCSPRALKLMHTFWPGPLTLVLPKSRLVPPEVTGGLNTVAVRMPDHPVARQLIAAAGVPVAAPSANLSGSPSPTTARHVLEDLAGRVDGVLDGGPSNLGVESTVLDISTGEPVILRPGGITAEQLIPVIGQVKYAAALEKDRQNIKPRSPGLKYKHYAPKAGVVLLEGRAEDIARHTEELIKRYQGENKKVGVLASAENARRYRGAEVLSYGSRGNPAAAAAVLYAALRRFDMLGVDVIIAEGMPDTGLGRAVMDRLRRAAGKIVKAAAAETDTF
ncbi:L-threonylcarbamoyladenylate synthase [Desulfohalotomaculum tongense]|uniref:L-threonylcarbamoyladenylate synthase n=1 Tax=Desulforadius tongensis TaxID=1216062 RepID=UPI0019581C2C|nr:L-threonylcarbamoyladenylate synthase [Desulforadius tongensis]MBM7853746.1 L-threonylcarbamoyladenylate synthase [Desulforadius tongensis]